MAVCKRVEMKAEAECQYCGEKWVVWTLSDKAPACLKCGDKNTRLRRRDPKDRNPYGYPPDDDIQRVPDYDWSD